MIRYFVIVAFAVAIVTPNVMEALARNKQKRTLASIRTVASALENYVADHPEWEPSAFEGSVAQMAARVPLVLPEKSWVKELPLRDGWMHPFGMSIATVKDGDEIAVNYQIWSTGRDGKRDPKWGSRKDGTEYATKSFDNDIVFTNGEFTQHPESV